MTSDDRLVARLVVGAAIVHEGRVLAARRTRPESAAGRWELPGGKVEPDEDAEAALRREVTEELGCTIEVTGWLPGRTRISDDLTLAVASARLVAGEPTPEPGEHDAVRWLAGDELDDVDWLESDRPFLPAVRELLARDRAGLRAVLFEEEHALAVAERLRTAGFEARVTRERYAGEDDDEDHPWAVTTDAPTLIVEPLVDEHDGWLDEGGEPGAPRPAARPADRSEAAPPTVLGSLT